MNNETMDGLTRYSAVLKYEDGAESGEFCDWFKTVDEAERFYRDIITGEGIDVENVIFYDTRVVILVRRPNLAAGLA